MRTPLLARCRAALIAGALAASMGVGAAYAVEVPAAAAPAAEEADPTVAPQPDRAPYPARAQRKLRRLHCGPGPIDGQIGERTQAAVIRFQSASGLRQTGRLTVGTRQALRSPTASPDRCLRAPGRAVAS